MTSHPPPSFARRSHPQCQLCALPHRAAGDGGCQTVCGNWSHRSPGQQCRGAAAAADAGPGPGPDPDAQADGQIPVRCKRQDRHWPQWEERQQWEERFRRVQHAGHPNGCRAQWGESVCRQQSQSGLANDTHCSLAGLVHRRWFVRGESPSPKKWGKNRKWD